MKRVTSQEVISWVTGAWEWDGDRFLLCTFLRRLNIIYLKNLYLKILCKLAFCLLNCIFIVLGTYREGRETIKVTNEHKRERNHNTYVRYKEVKILSLIHHHPSCVLNQFFISWDIHNWPVSFIVRDYIGLLVCIRLVWKQAFTVCGTWVHWSLQI